MKDIEYYYNDNDEIGVLVSYGFGAGWSTWSKDYGIKLALDKRIIEEFLKHNGDKHWAEQITAYKDNETKKEFENFLSNIGYNNIFLVGLPKCELEFVPAGSAIKIDEYDGNENLIIGYSEFTVLD